MADNPLLGRSILQAFQFMKAVQKDTQEVIRAMDRLMAQEKWHCNETKIASHLSTTLNADKWMLRSAYRIYVRDVDVQVSFVMGALLINFVPPEGYDEPVCLCVAAGFTTPVSSKTVWDRWQAANTAKLLRALLANNSRETRDPKLVKWVMPDAERGCAFTTRLCDLTDESNVKSLAAVPLLRAIEQLNNP
jgi:hypothetical protein